MAHVHGRVAGSKPQHKVGDKSVVLLGRTANPPVRESHVEAGFERFFGCKEPTGTLNRKPITWQHQDVHSRPKGRRYLEPTKHEDRQRGKGMPEPIPRASPRNRGLRYIPERRSDVATGCHFDRKARVVDPATGKRKIDLTSKSWEFHELYGRLKQFGGTRSKAFHHGIFPSEKNYPPSHDKNGKWIDYSLVQYGGNLCDRGLRIEEEPVPVREELNARGTLPRGAAQRYQRQRKVNAINAGQASLEDFTLRRSQRVPATAPASGSGAASRGRVTSSGSRRAMRSEGGASADWRDAKLAALRAELNSLQSKR